MGKNNQSIVFHGHKSSTQQVYIEIFSQSPLQSLLSPTSANCSPTRLLVGEMPGFSGRLYFYTSTLTPLQMNNLHKLHKEPATQA